MSAQRGAGPAAIAAVLIGVGLTLYRPRLVPVLRAVPHHEPPAPAAALASSISWPASPWRTASGVGAVAGAEQPFAWDESANEEDDWHDAPADTFAPPSYVAAIAHTPAGSPARASASGAKISASSDAHRRHRTKQARSFAGTKSQVMVSDVRAPRLTKRRISQPRSATAPRNPAAAFIRWALRRAPLAKGPAAVTSTNAATRTAGAQMRNVLASISGSTWPRRHTRSFPLFKPPRRTAAARAKKHGARRRVRPLLLSKLLGRHALRPPPASVKLPTVPDLKKRKPSHLPDGSPVPTLAYEFKQLEALNPRSAGAARDRRRAAHWDGRLWHAGSARGLSEKGRWLWLWKEKSRWWAELAADEAPLLHHRNLWWSKKKDVWFALHDGTLWSWRRFSDWDAEGLIRLTDGVELVYSADFTKVAVITPGAGAVLYDAATGAKLGEWLESELPRRKPRAPSDLRLPHGI